MTRRSTLIGGGGAVLLLGAVLAWGDGRGESTAGASLSREEAVKYILVTVRAFRTIYVRNVEEHLAKAGIRPKEEWSADPHSIMLPFQFVKVAADRIKASQRDLKIGVISLTPIYSANFPKTQAEVDALRSLTANPAQPLLTFQDGKAFKGVIGDFAIEQSCVDCHNHHPNSPRTDFKKGDLMGAIIVRLDGK